jgi:protein involved in polysaccharide export with SLBB domain
MDTKIRISPSFIAGLIALLVLLAACAAPQDITLELPATSSQSRASEEYRLGTGDVISIRVYGGEEDLRLERIRLDHSGVVSMPFGQFGALGRTTHEVEAAIMQSVQGRLLRNPRVWVNIDEYRPFFVEGQVGRPGAYPYQPGLNVRKAVTIAGGLKERASLRKIYVFRERDGGTVRLKVDLNSPVAPGDTVIVEESFF